MASARQICTTTAINTVSCYKSNCIPASHGNPGDCRFVRASNTRQLRLVKRNGVSETNLHDHCNQHGQLLQIQLHSRVARQSRRLSIRRSVEHAPVEIDQTKWRQRDKSAQPLQSTRSVVTNPIAFQRRTAIQAIVDSSERRTRAN
jgi:hypothetical protein